MRIGRRFGRDDLSGRERGWGEEGGVAVQWVCMYAMAREARPRLDKARSDADLKQTMRWMMA